MKEHTKDLGPPRSIENISLMLLRESVQQHGCEGLLWFKAAHIHGFRDQVDE